MKRLFVNAALLSLSTAMLTAIAHADESLATCEAEKTRQMELTREIKSAPTTSVDRYTGRTYSRINKKQLQDDVNRMDEWLWKNCRSYSSEMRNIEQQYM